MNTTFDSVCYYQYETILTILSSNVKLHQFILKGNEKVFSCTISKPESTTHKNENSNRKMISTTKNKMDLYGLQKFVCLAQNNNVKSQMPSSVKNMDEKPFCASINYIWYRTPQAWVISINLLCTPFHDIFYWFQYCSTSPSVY